MKRRNFIQTTGLTLPLLLNGFKLKATPKSSIFSAINEYNDRVLVLVQLNGGNDGLGMITPLDQYDKLANARGNILIPTSSLLDVGSNQAFHPSMSGIRSLYDEGKMGVVQAAGYPNQNRSHFRSTDIWTSGSPYDEYWATGWLGRYFQMGQPNFPVGYPNGDFEDPFALTLGGTVSETCQGFTANFSMAIKDPTMLNQLVTGGSDTVPNTPYGEELDYLRQSIDSTNAYSNGIMDAANSASNMVTYPDTELGSQLKNIALLIAGGLQTKVYVANLGGFDTHAGQVALDPTLGTQSELLQTLSDAIAAFQQDLTMLGLEKRVLTMTFSEFGRRIRSNDSFGTDHGDAAPLMLFGSCVKPGFTGDSPEIPENPSVQEAVAMQYDFRNIYGSVLMDWFEVAQEDVKSLLFPDFSYVPLVNGCNVSSTFEPAAELEILPYPNPFFSEVKVAFRCANEHVHLSVFNGAGQLIKTLISKQLNAGEHTISFDGTGLASGSYYFHLRLENGRQKTRLVVKS
ncbi:MAG: DUF1501 domain-containing protein [Saprospiraceae bacterium]|nr:DUF1501 domain-containing protein [Saprospiraceae bacterium]